jgi:septal ring factor EnvC (AmiA/AmiB activator)
LVPYFEVVDKLLVTIEQIDQRMVKKEEQSKSEIKSLKRQIGYKDKTIETLEKQLAQLQQKNTHPIFEQFNEIVNQNVLLDSYLVYITQEKQPA